MQYNPKKHRLPICDLSGVLLVDKPAGWTSFDVVNFVRSRFNIPKVGHCGTLDPAATGLLVLMLGKFTTLSSRFSGDDKVYEGTMRLGMETDSGDLDGTVIATADPGAVTAAQIAEVLARFRGEQMQVPPMVSAVKIGGKKLYELARKGEEIEREPRKIFIRRLDITACTPPDCSFVLECSKGTYVRTLCSDAGKLLGCGAVLTALRRTRSGRFDLADAFDIETLKSFDQAELAARVAERLGKLAGGIK